MKTKLFLAAAVAALSLGAGVAQADTGSPAVEPAGIRIHLGFGYPYYSTPYYYRPYYAPYYYQPYQGPYQYCHLGVCY
jgi:hypothetical protein